MKTSYSVGSLIYDAHIYDGMNSFLDDFPFYKRWMPKHPNAQVLELCCGTGRLTIPLAKAGYAISGVDFTDSMLQMARQKAVDNNLDLDFFKSDIRDFNLGRQFDLIFLPFNSIHHMYTNEDLFKALNSVKNHLKNDGLFILDCFNPNIRFLVEREHKESQISQYQTTDGRHVVIKEVMTYEDSSQINRIQWHYYINGEYNSTQNLDMRMFYPQELNAYLLQSGFKILHKYGSFEEADFDSTSDKQIFVCQKL